MTDLFLHLHPVRGEEDDEDEEEGRLKVHAVVLTQTSDLTREKIFLQSQQLGRPFSFVVHRPRKPDCRLKYVTEDQYSSSRTSMSRPINNQYLAEILSKII